MPRDALTDTAGHPLAISDPFLAHLIAMEWDLQDHHINRQTMHLTSLAFTAVDDASGQTRAERTDQLVHHLSTDTLLYRQEIPTELHDFQIKHWDPLLQWFKHRFGSEIRTSLELDRVHQPESTLASLRVRIVLFGHC
jgi:chaperone required for assembly of F1-ATPase